MGIDVLSVLALGSVKEEGEDPATGGEEHGVNMGSTRGQHSADGRQGLMESRHQRPSHSAHMWPIATYLLLL